MKYGFSAHILRPPGALAFMATYIAVRMYIEARRAMLRDEDGHEDGLAY